MSKDRRADILNAASELFAQRGFRGTTTRDLASHAGVNEAIIFRHFKTKQDLYSAILDSKACEHRQSGCEDMQRLTETGDDSEVFLSVARQALKNLLEDDARFFRLLLYSGLEGHELTEMFYASYVRPGREALAAYIQKRIDEGAFQAVDANLAARAFMGMFVSYALGRAVFRFQHLPQVEPEAALDSFVSIFLSGIKK